VKGFCKDCTRWRECYLHYKETERKDRQKRGKLLCSEAQKYFNQDEVSQAHLIPAVVTDPFVNPEPQPFTDSVGTSKVIELTPEQQDWSKLNKNAAVSTQAHRKRLLDPWWLKNDEDNKTDPWKPTKNDELLLGNMNSCKMMWNQIPNFDTFTSEQLREMIIWLHLRGKSSKDISIHIECNRRYSDRIIKEYKAGKWTKKGESVLLHGSKRQLEIFLKSKREGK